MTTFDERETAFEAKFALDQAMQFKVDARANKLLGLWAAEKLGKSGDAAQAYAQDVIKSDLKEAGSDDVIEKVTTDLNGLVTKEDVGAMRVGFLREVKSHIMED